MSENQAPVIEIEIEPLWRIENVMHYLGVSRREVLRLTHERGLPFCKLAGKTSPLRFRPEAVRAWVIEREFQIAS